MSELIKSLTTDNALRRNAALWAVAVLFALCLAGAIQGVRWLWWGAAIVLPLLAIALWDLVQTRHSLRRNYPLAARIRWISEGLRPFLRPYIVEGPLDGRPYDLVSRTLIYERAKHVEDAHPFGTELDVYSDEYEALGHSIVPHEHAPRRTRVRVGTDQCSKPYHAAWFNISAMSFGALGSHAVQALNLGAKIGDFYHDTGEGGLTKYHLQHGGDIVWEIGSGYFGCRQPNGKFDPALFADKA